MPTRPSSVPIDAARFIDPRVVRRPYTMGLIPTGQPTTAKRQMPPVRHLRPPPFSFRPTISFNLPNAERKTYETANKRRRPFQPGVGPAGGQLKCHLNLNLWLETCRRRIDPVRRRAGCFKCRRSEWGIEMETECVHERERVLSICHRESDPDRRHFPSDARTLTRAQQPEAIKHGKMGRNFNFPSSLDIARAR